MLPSRYRYIDATPLNGGYGTVYPVHDTYLDRTVLFKSMQDKKNNQQLINEIQHLSSARSRHVVEIYDTIVDEAGDIQGIIIEYLQGRDYENFHLESSNAEGYIRALYQMSTAVADLHSFGVIHRDLKLDNVKNSASGILKIFDFGISSSGLEYRTTNNRGTYVYAAPELFLANAMITQEMDIYALGVCAWALAAPDFPEELNQIPPQSQSEAPSIQTALPSLPSEVAKEIDKCLSVDPTRRPNARDLSNLLAKYVVRGKHKGLIVEDQRAVYELSETQKSVTLSVGALGKIKISYDGLDFEATPLSGYICINNEKIDAPSRLPEACVLTFGQPELKSSRQWLSFFSSRPEVVL